MSFQLRPLSELPQLAYQSIGGANASLGAILSPTLGFRAAVNSKQLQDAAEAIARSDEFTLSADKNKHSLLLRKCGQHVFLHPRSRSLSAEYPVPSFLAGSPQYGSEEYDCDFVCLSASNRIPEGSFVELPITTPGSGIILHHQPVIMAPVFALGIGVYVDSYKPSLNDLRAWCYAYPLARKMLEQNTQPDILWRTLLLNIIDDKLQAGIVDENQAMALNLYVSNLNQRF